MIDLIDGWIRTLALCAAFATALAGCGGAGEVVTDPDALPFVQCKVVLAGQDVAGAVVTFHADGEFNRRIVSAFDSENDCYRFITTVADKRTGGVPEGEYRVSVKPGRGTRARIPGRYADPKTSGLTARIVAGNNFLPPFELNP
jgi:hypothetical protein